MARETQAKKELLYSQAEFKGKIKLYDLGWKTKLTHFQYLQPANDFQNKMRTELKTIKDVSVKPLVKSCKTQGVLNNLLEIHRRLLRTRVWPTQKLNPQKSSY